jgi:hypothetical protein
MEKIISDNGSWYKVQYDGNDEEQLTHWEVTKYVEQANNKVTTRVDGPTHTKA